MTLRIERTFGTFVFTFVLIFFAVLGCTSSQSKKLADKNGSDVFDPRSSLEAPKVLPEAMLSSENVFSRIAFGSCVDQTLPQPVWNQILSARPELYLSLGDNVYISKYRTETFQSAYEKQLGVSEFINFRNLVPMLSIWDDQDYGQNDGDFTNPKKDEAKEYFLKFFSLTREILAEANKGYPKEGLYYSKILGPSGKRIQIIFLDVRWYRSPWTKISQEGFEYKPDDSPDKTMLGDEQWKWLESQLQISGIRSRVLVSGIQVLNTDDTFEKWGNFPKERDRLLDLLFQSQRKSKAPVVILSGDRHAGEISVLKRGGQKLVDVTASAINKPSTREAKNSLRQGAHEKNPNFGLMTFNWSKKTLDLEVVDEKGKVVSRQKLALSPN